MVLLSIVLQILKWIGIILGGLVGLVLLLILLVLFVPIRYRIEGQKNESADAHIKFTWLLHLVRFVVDWESGGELLVKLKVLFFTVWKNDSPDKEEEFEPETEEDFADLADLEAELNASKPAAIEASEPEIEEVELPQNVNIMDIIAPEGVATECEVYDITTDEDDLIAEEQRIEEKKRRKEAKKAEKAARREQKKAEKAAKAEKKAQAKANGEIKSLDEKIEALFEKIAEIAHKPVELLDKFNRKKDVIEEFINSEKNRAGVKITWEILVKALKAIAPRKGRGQLTFGTGDPASTGKALAALSILYASLRGKFQVTPDFEEKVLTGEGYIKGRIFIITILVLFCKLWFNENFKTLKTNASQIKERVQNA